MLTELKKLKFTPMSELDTWQVSPRQPGKRSNLFVDITNYFSFDQHVLCTFNVRNPEPYVVRRFWGVGFSLT